MFNFWKHKTKGNVISDRCKNDLPLWHQRYYEPTNDLPTHKVETCDIDNSNADGYFLTSLISETVIESVFDSSSTGDSDSSNSGSSDFSGFGGGDDGGGGATGDF